MRRVPALDAEAVHEAVDDDGLDTCDGVLVVGEVDRDRSDEVLEAVLPAVGPEVPQAGAHARAVEEPIGIGPHRLHSMSACRALTSVSIEHQRSSPFTIGSVPSSALIDKVLREVEDASDTVLDEHTVDVLCRRLRETAQLLAELELTTNPADRAESFRYLLLMMAYAVDAGLLNADPLEPMFSQPYRLHLLDWGGASPDAVYRRAMVRDDRSYRVHGRLGNARYLSFDLRQSSPACTITRDELDLGPDGEFELFLGGTPRKRAWWPLSAGTSGVVVREFFDDWLAAERSRAAHRLSRWIEPPAPRAQCGPGRGRSST